MLTLDLLLSFLFADMFDTAGTLVGVSQQVGYLDENGDLSVLKLFTG